MSFALVKHVKMAIVLAVKSVNAFACGNVQTTTRPLVYLIIKYVVPVALKS